jgi:catechol 2,3-dioxygenase
MDRISPNTTVGAVALNVGRLEPLVGFYQSAIGLRVHRTVGRMATMGVGGKDLLVLHEEPEAKRPPHASPGLFHLAIRVPSRAALADALGHLVEQNVPLHGAADHLVSEALYMADPEGNGIEIYRDRPREQWSYRNGMVQMTTEPLDLDALFAERSRSTPWAGLSEGTVMGHVHLRVADLPKAERFYSEVIGFDVMARYGAAAAFLSAGGYHHHLGINTWNSLGAPAQPPLSLGLRHFEIRVPDQGEVNNIVRRVTAAGYAAEPVSRGFLVRDPSGNALVIGATGDA